MMEFLKVNMSLSQFYELGKSFQIKNIKIYGLQQFAISLTAFLKNLLILSVVDGFPTCIGRLTSM